jgi:hypothetical protein
MGRASPRGEAYATDFDVSSLEWNVIHRFWWQMEMPDPPGVTVRGRRSPQRPIGAWIPGAVDRGALIGWASDVDRRA